MRNTTTQNLISVGMKDLNHQPWNGDERRRAFRPVRNPNWKFKEVRLPTYVSNDSKLNLSGFYPASH